MKKLLGLVCASNVKEWRDPRFRDELSTGSRTPSTSICAVVKYKLQGVDRLAFIFGNHWLARDVLYLTKAQSASKVPQGDMLFRTILLGQ